MDDIPDLELLTLFHLLHRERHLTRAGLKAGKSQPAMSRALDRMRKLLHDPLFVRTPAGMAPTPRADALAPEVERLLDAARAVVRQGVFEPRRLERTFVVGTADLVEAHLLAALSQAMAREAPGANLVMRQTGQLDLAAELATGRFDLIIESEVSLPAGAMRQHLYDDRYACAVRRDHPRARRKLSLETYLALGHVQFAPHGTPGGPVDAALTALGHSRRVAVRTQSFLAAPFLIAHSDFVFTAPALVLEALAALLNLRLFEPPVELPAIRTFQAWHPRMQEDAAHRWFRSLISRAMRGATPRAPASRARADPAPGKPAKAP